MRGEFILPLATLFGFLMVLARVGAALAFIPIPGIRNGPRVARVVLALSFTMALLPLWPEIAHEPGPAELAGWMISEAALGLSVGLAVTFLTEVLLLCAQLAGLQAGYSYASTVDPTTQADASVLLVLAQLMAGVLFFTLGLHREVLRVLAHSLAAFPPGQFAISRGMADGMLSLSASLFSVGLPIKTSVINYTQSIFSQFIIYMSIILHHI
jgi:flagellar biosynthetic protein FliR